MEDIEKLHSRISELERMLALFDQPGAIRLHYALKRKMNEMANILNATNLQNISLDDPKDKTFERIRFIINDSAGIASAAKLLGEAAGVSGDEDKDVIKRQRTTPESIADVLSNSNGQ